MKEPDWLSEEERKTWMAFLAASTLVLRSLDRQLQRDAGIPHSWYGVLALLSERPEHRVRQGELAGFADFSLSRLSHAIAKMEERGWISREVDPDDRRAWDVVLTDNGLEAMKAMAPGHVATVRALFFDVLTPRQVTEIGRAFTKIQAQLESSAP